MPSTLEVRHLLRPQRAEKGDLLLDPLAAIGEAHSQRFVLDLVPADADAEDEAPAREHVHLRRLLCHKRGLPLRQDQDRGRERQPPRDRGEVAEHDEWLVERRAVVIAAGPAARPVGVSAEDVIEDHEAVVAQILDALRVLRDRVWVGPDLKLREDRACPHEVQYRGAGRLRESAPSHPGIRADNAVEQHDERVFGWSQTARQVDPHDPRSTETDGGPPIRADDRASEQARWGETRGTRADEVLGLIGPDMHEIAPVGPDAVEPEVACNLEAALRASVTAVRTDAPHARIRHEEPGRVAGCRDG